MAATADATLDRSESAIALHPAQPRTQLAKPVTNHLFVSNIRFLSMAAVVLSHSIVSSFRLVGLGDTGWLERTMRQPVEFDVIGFFLISGFLLEEGMTRWRPAEYLSRRFQRIFLPWLAWFSVYCGINLAGASVHGRFRFDSMHGVTLPVLHAVRDGLLSPFWFVPNLLLALCILLACRRFLFDLRMGSILLALSLFYGLNIYMHWAHFENHTEALLGFVFYLWLGAWGARNFAAIQTWIAHTSMLFLIVMAVLAGLGALLESSLLAAAGNSQPLNILRISNQIYSIATVLVILKFRKPVWPRAMNVRTVTFGIYLTQAVVMLLLLNMVNRTFLSRVTGLSGGAQVAAAFCLTLACFAVTYWCAFALTVWLLRHPRLCWMVGNRGNGSAGLPETALPAPLQ